MSDNLIPRGEKEEKKEKQEKSIFINIAKRTKSISCSLKDIEKFLNKTTKACKYIKLYNLLK